MCYRYTPLFDFFTKSLENEARVVYYINIKREVCNHDCSCMSHVFIKLL